MRNTAQLFALTAVLALAACGKTPRPNMSAPPKVQPIGNSEQLSDVIGALEAGDEKRARKILKKMVSRDPGDRRVALLRESIDGDPVTLLGAKSFGYSLKRSDTMMSLAQRYLGERLKFHLLVRYNGRKNSQIVPGEIIRIPGNEPVAPPVAVRPKAEPEPTKTAPQPAPVIRGPVKPASNPALAAALRVRGLGALNQGRIGDAVATLQRARAADPANVAIARDLVRAERLLASVKARK